METMSSIELPNHLAGAFSSVENEPSFPLLKGTNPALFVNERISALPSRSACGT